MLGVRTMNALRFFAIAGGIVSLLTLSSAANAWSSKKPVDEARADESKIANRKIYNDTSTGSAPSKFQYFKPFSKEWKQRREEEARRLKAATTICRC
jgi:hypothetical protein